MSFWRIERSGVWAMIAGRSKAQPAKASARYARRAGAGISVPAGSGAVAHQ